jgi:hypothetical protein
MSRDKIGRPARRRAPLALLSALVALVVIVLVVALLLTARANNQQTATGQALVATLRTEVAGLQKQAVARQTEIAQQQHRIEQLQRLVAAAQTPTYQANGPHSYIVLFQVENYSCILYLQWDESNGIIHNGRLLTADNYARNGSKSFTFTGVDNNGRFGFTASGQGMTMAFTGTANRDGTFTAAGLPWYVFYGFTGGTFTQTLHPGTLQEYNAAVANLPAPHR